MTKFEEEFKALTSWDWVNVDLIQQILTRFGNWHSDEEFQEIMEIGGKFALANKNLIDVNTKIAEEISNLKSQLQNQSLPVVPECVAEFIKRYKDRRTIYGVFDKISKNRKTYPKLYEWVFEDENSQATFALAFITGKYEVEKPHLFYLRDELTGQFLAKDNQFKDRDRYFFWTGEDPLTHSIGTAWKLSFTQQEIDSMQTGSYEQIEVAE